MPLHDCGQALCIVYIYHRWQQIVFASQQAPQIILIYMHGSPIFKTSQPSRVCWPDLPVIMLHAGSVELDPLAPNDEFNTMAYWSGLVISVLLTFLSQTCSCKVICDQEAVFRAWRPSPSVSRWHAADSTQGFSMGPPLSLSSLNYDSLFHTPSASWSSHFSPEAPWMPCPDGPTSITFIPSPHHRRIPCPTTTVQQTRCSICSHKP